MNGSSYKMLTKSTWQQEI